MKENVEQINHLAEVLYSESKGFYAVSNSRGLLGYIFTYYPCHVILLAFQPRVLQFVEMSSKSKYFARMF